MDDDLRRRAEARIGTVLRGKYRIEQVLGVGGMAAVYAATHRNQKRVAIKVLHPELSLHADVRARFMREGYAANTVDHPGAVAVLDDDTAEDGAAFLVMERLEGEEVESLWERQGSRLDARVVLSIAEPLLAVLEAAHAKAIVHRDIKPANLYVTRDGTLKVLDFGIARARDALSEGQRGTQTGMLMGTPAFMAPEQALGKSSEMDGTTDVWAVGATMFALLSGKQVHEGETSTALLVQAATQPARSLALAAPGTDPRLVAVVDRALAFDKAARWPSAAAMRAAVRDVHLAMFGTPVNKEPLEQLVGTPIGSSATVIAPSVPPVGGSSAPPARISAPTPAPVATSILTHASRPSHAEAMPSNPGASWGNPVAPGVTAADPAASPKKTSLLVPALLVSVVSLGGAALVAYLLVGRTTTGNGQVASAQTTAAQAPSVEAAPAPTTVTTEAPSVASADGADADAPSAVANADAPSSTQVKRRPAPAASTASVPSPVPTPSATPPPVPTPPPASTPVPVPTAAPPPPTCRAQCSDTARACKSRCKAQYHHIGHERHQCQVDCEAIERVCKSHAPC